MGFFDGYANVSDTVSNATAPSYSNPKPDNYYFEVTGAELQVGNKKDASALALIIKYALTNSDEKTITYNEYNAVPNPTDPRNPTEREAQQAGFLKARLLSLGIAEDKINTFEADDLIGVEGSLRVVAAKNPDYVTLRDVKVKGSTAKAAPAAPAATKPTATKPPARRAPAKVSTPLPADEGGPVQDHEPEAEVATAPKAKPQSVVGNPFAR